MRRVRLLRFIFILEGDFIVQSVSKILEPSRIFLGGTHLKMGYRYVLPLRPPFHALLATPEDLHFIIFQFLKTLFLLVSAVGPLFSQSLVQKIQINHTLNHQTKMFLHAKELFFSPGGASLYFVLLRFSIYAVDINVDG